MELTLDQTYYLKHDVFLQEIHGKLWHNKQYINALKK